MPAFRGKNLRSGDLAEQLGILLLQSIALVAPVPRTEDIGIDVVATLIRHFDNYKYIAEESFFVQIKSSSITEITFENEEVSWLSNLQLPFFIGLIDRKTATIQLYNTHNLSETLVMNPNRKKITLHMQTNKDFSPSIEDESITIPIGPSIIQWSLDSIENNKDFIQQIYILLKQHIRIAMKSLASRRVGVSELIKWETNEVPVVYGNILRPVGTLEEMDEIVAPYLNAMLHRFLLGEDMLTARSLYRALEKTLDMNGHFEFLDGKRVLSKYPKSIDEKTSAGS